MDYSSYVKIISRLISKFIDKCLMEAGLKGNVMDMGLKLGFYGGKSILSLTGSEHSSFLFINYHRRNSGLTDYGGQNKITCVKH